MAKFFASMKRESLSLFEKVLSKFEPCLNSNYRHPTDEESCLVRFVDTGEMQRYKAHEVYALNESFTTIPNQAFTLHLTGIVPADREDDWDPTITEQLKKELAKWTFKEADTIYEANVLFALRNTLVVNVMRLYNMSTTVVHCSLKSYLQRRNFGIMSPEMCDKVIAMAKSAGKLNASPAMLAANLLMNLFWFFIE